MRQTVLALSILGAILSTLGFVSNWWTGRFETFYAPTISLLTRAYGIAALVFIGLALWSGWPRRGQ